MGTVGTAGSNAQRGLLHQGVLEDGRDDVEVDVVVVGAVVGQGELVVVESCCVQACERSRELCCPVLVGSARWFRCRGGRGGPFSRGAL